MNDTTPQETVNQMNPINPPNIGTYIYDKKWSWALAFIAAIIAIWIGVAWIHGWFPFFSYQKDILQEVRDSLTATGIPAEIPASVIDGLTKTTSVTENVPASVLDSLTAK